MRPAGRPRRDRLRAAEHGGPTGGLNALAGAGALAAAAWLAVLLHPARPWDLRPTDEEGGPAPEPRRLAGGRRAGARAQRGGDAAADPAGAARAGLPRRLERVLVDDRSDDGTAAVARSLAAGDPRLRAVDGAPLPEGWVGKVWALEQARRAAGEAPGGTPDLLLLTDADIRHAPGSLRRLVAEAQAGSSTW